MKIGFEKVTTEHLDTIWGWLAEPWVRAFWDNTEGHKDDIVNFVQGRKTPSTCAKGKYVYWIAKAEDEPFAMLMTVQETHKHNIGVVKQDRLSKTGHTYSLDYMIGNQDYFGKGYGASTLAEFVDYFRAYIDPKADTFLIDPSQDNPRAKHVYMKAGFEHVADFVMEGDCSGAGKLHHLLIKRFPSKPSLSKVL
jgi:RimJ/RimL family protein N-acetyltransferase